MNNWKETNLGNIANLTIGRTPPRKETEWFTFKNGDWKWMSIKDMAHCGMYINKTSEYLSDSAVKQFNIPIIKKGTIVLSFKMTLGRVAITAEDMLSNEAIAHVNFKNNDVDTSFFYYYLKNYNFNSLGSTSSIVDAVNTKVLKEIKVFLPSLKEQRLIASVLSSLDNKIELLRKQNETLEKIAQTIFRRWFVEFEFPDKNGKPYKSSGGKMIESELGEIPEGWYKVGLSGVANFLNGLALQKFPPKDNNYLPVIKIKEMNVGITDQTDKASLEIDKKYIVNNGDVLFSWSGSLDVCVWKYRKGALNQHLFKVTSDNFPKWYYFYWIKFHLPEFRQIATAKAVTMGHIKRHHLDDAIVNVPDQSFLENANKTFIPIFSNMILNNNQIQTLSKLRDTLLPKLMRGEVRVK